MSLLNRLLALPATRGLDIDDPRTTALRRQIIKDKPFLYRIYKEWYAMLTAMPYGGKNVLELGSGAGFFKEVFADAITSEVFHYPNMACGLVADARCLPFPDRALDGIVMTDVLHHIPDPRRFFTEAGRCIRPGGMIAMIEPWVTPWSTFIYTHFHHEPFLPQAERWELPEGGGHLSSANGAMPWIMFRRDREQFEREFPEWEIRVITPFMPVRYLLSGGVSMRSLAPGWSFGLLKALEGPFCSSAAMFAHIVLVRKG